jgi:putative ABC transport system substrate-binding protein
MDRRAFTRIMAGALVTAALVVKAQQPRKVYRVGWLGPGNATTTGLSIDIFKKELRDLGYTEGQNVILDLRYADGEVERLPRLAAELVALKPDVIVAVTTPATRAAKEATSTIPIVMTFVSDAIGSGFIASLAHPRGNVTGVVDFGIDVAAKTIELVRTVVPKAGRIAILMNDNPSHPSQLKEIQDAATRIGLTVLPTMARSPEDLDGAFASLKSENAGALIVLGGLPHTAQRQKIAELALKSVLPTIFLTRHYVLAGGLLSYGPSFAQMHTLPATFVDRIFKGSKPGDLPVEQPTKFELVINLKTAQALGLTIPQSLLLRADEVIQ